MEFVSRILEAAPVLAIFVSVALGYLIGKIKIGRFVLGGIAGTLIVGVVVGQLGVNVDDNIKNIFFALFIYAVGYQGGPQFFHALNPRTLNQLLSAFVMCLAGTAALQRVSLPAALPNRRLLERRMMRSPGSALRQHK